MDPEMAEAIQRVVDETNEEFHRIKGQLQVALTLTSRGVTQDQINRYRENLTLSGASQDRSTRLGRLFYEGQAHALLRLAEILDQRQSRHST